MPFTATAFRKQEKDREPVRFVPEKAGFRESLIPETRRAFANILEIIGAPVKPFRPDIIPAKEGIKVVRPLGRIFTEALRPSKEQLERSPLSAKISGDIIATLVTAPLGPAKIVQAIRGAPFLGRVAGYSALGAIETAALTDPGIRKEAGVIGGIVGGTLPFFGVALRRILPRSAQTTTSNIKDAVLPTTRMRRETAALLDDTTPDEIKRRIALDIVNADAIPIMLNLIDEGIPGLRLGERQATKVRGVAEVLNRVFREVGVELKTYDVVNEMNLAQLRASRAEFTFVDSLEEAIHGIRGRAVQLGAAITSKRPVVTNKEAVMLRKMIREDIAGTARKFKKGFREVNRIIKKSFREQQSTINAMRTSVVKLFRDTLPDVTREQARAKAQLIAAASGIQSPTQARKVLETAGRKADIFVKKNLFQELELAITKPGEIFRLGKTRLKPELIDPSIRNLMNDTFVNFNIRRNAGELGQRLQSLHDQASRKKILSEGLLSDIRGFLGQDLQALDTIRLSQLRDIVRRINEQGAILSFFKKSLFGEQIERETGQFIADTVTKRGWLDSPLVPEQTRTILRGARNFFVNLLMDPARVADNIDGGLGTYSKTNARKVIKFQNLATESDYATQGQTGRGLERLRERGLDRIIDGSDEQNVRITANILEQQGATSWLRNLLEGVGLTKTPVLREGEQEVINILRNELNINTDAIEAIHQATTDRLFKRVTNYFRIKRDTKKMFKGDLSQEFDHAEDIADVINPGEVLRGHNVRLKATTPNKFTRTRVEGVKNTPRTDFMNVWSEALSEQNWYIHLHPDIVRMSKIVRSNRYLNAVSDETSGFWKDYLDVLSRRGWAESARFGVGQQALLATRRNITKAVLGFRPSTILMQPFAVIEGMAIANKMWGPKAAAEVFGEVMKSLIKPGFAQDIIARSPSLQLRRMSAGEEVLADIIGGTRRAKRFYDRFVRAAFKPIQIADVRTAAGIQSAIERRLTQNGIPNAQRQAEFLTRMINGSANVANRPLIMSKGAFARSMFTFQNFFLARWGTIVYDLVQTGVFHPSWKVKLGSAMGLATYLAGDFAEDTARDFVNDFIRSPVRERKRIGLGMRSLLFIPKNIPVVGSVFAGIDYGFRGKIDMPLTRMAEDVGYGAVKALTSKEATARARFAVRGTEALTSILFGVPGTSTVFDMAEGMINRIERQRKVRRRIARETR